MKKYFISSLLAIVIIFGVTLSFASANVTTPPTSVSQLVELLITIGVIAPDKAVAARAAIANLGTISSSQASISTVSTSTAYIQVLSPNGGESWEIDLDVPYSITWGSVGLSEVRVALVSTAKNSPNCELGLTPITSKDGNREYKILPKTARCYNLTTGSSTPLTDGTYKARVYYSVNASTTISDESNATFKILPKPIPSLKVTYPNGAENLKRNNEYTIKYTLTNVDRSLDDLIYYRLVDNNGNSLKNGHKLINSTRTFDLELPSSLSVGAYKLKLSLTTRDRVEIEDTSDNFFWVSSAN